VPLCLDRIVARAIERNPRARYWTAAQFQTDLVTARPKVAALQIDGSGELELLSAEWDGPTRRVLPRRRTG
jgi:hypothetical protein